MVETRELLALRAALARSSPVGAAELAKAMGVSIATLHRYLARLPSTELLSAGQARRTRYALRRPVRGGLADLPVYAVDLQGQAQQVCALAALRPEGCWMALAHAGWPVPAESSDGWWPGLPYPLYDMQPQGYMGRLFARLERQSLGVSANPEDWNDDDILHVLSQRGCDASGNLIVGDAAYALWQSQRVSQPPALEPDQTAPAYAQLAGLAVAAGIPGSSAAGEFPKFAARRHLAGSQAVASQTSHVLVKFSGDDDSPAVRRWSDLLVCEHLALEHLGRLPGQAVARSRVLQQAGRTFLETERFDRHGEFGRSPLCTLEAVNGALLGMQVADWEAVAQALLQRKLLGPEDARRITRQWWFGRLIANTDMHAGNLGFRPAQGRLSLAPAYDMLPMLHAPLAGGEVPRRDFEPPLPLPRQREDWHLASEAALLFWRAASGDDRISPAFRSLCAAHGARLQAVKAHA